MYQKELRPRTLVGRSFSVTTFLSDLNWHLPFFAPQFPIFKQGNWTRCSMRHLLASLSIRRTHTRTSRLGTWNIVRLTGCFFSQKALSPHTPRLLIAKFTRTLNEVPKCRIVIRVKSCSQLCQYHSFLKHELGAPGSTAAEQMSEMEALP